LTSGIYTLSLHDALPILNNKMTFRGKEVLVWSINNYLGLSNHPAVRKIDAEAAAQWGMGYPMGARMMSGQTSLHEKLENELADRSEEHTSELQSRENLVC